MVSIDTALHDTLLCQSLIISVYYKLLTIFTAYIIALAICVDFFWNAFDLIVPACTLASAHCELLVVNVAVVHTDENDMHWIFMNGYCDVVQCHILASNGRVIDVDGQKATLRININRQIEFSSTNQNYSYSPCNTSIHFDNYIVCRHIVLDVSRDSRVLSMFVLRLSENQRLVAEVALLNVISFFRSLHTW